MPNEQLLQSIDSGSLADFHRSLQDPNTQIELPDGKSDTPLIRICRKMSAAATSQHEAYVEMIKMLIKANVNLNAQGAQGETALIILVTLMLGKDELNSPEFGLAKLLCENGADFEFENKHIPLDDKKNQSAKNLLEREIARTENEVKARVTELHQQLSVIARDYKVFPDEKKAIAANQLKCNITSRFWGRPDNFKMLCQLFSDRRYHIYGNELKDTFDLGLSIKEGNLFCNGTIVVAKNDTENKTIPEIKRLLRNYRDPHEQKTLEDNIRLLDHAFLFRYLSPHQIILKITPNEFTEAQACELIRLLGSLALNEIALYLENFQANASSIQELEKALQENTHISTLSITLRPHSDAKENHPQVDLVHVIAAASCKTKRAYPFRTFMINSIVPADSKMMGALAEIKCDELVLDMPIAQTDIDILMTNAKYISNFRFPIQCETTIMQRNIYWGILNNPRIRQVWPITTAYEKYSQKALQRNISDCKSYDTFVATMARVFSDDLSSILPQEMMLLTLHYIASPHDLALEALITLIQNMMPKSIQNNVRIELVSYEQKLEKPSIRKFLRLTSPYSAILSLLRNELVALATKNDNNPFLFTMLSPPNAFSGGAGYCIDISSPIELRLRMAEIPTTELARLREFPTTNANQRLQIANFFRSIYEPQLDVLPPLEAAEVLAAVSEEKLSEQQSEKFTQLNVLDVIRHIRSMLANPPIKTIKETDEKKDEKLAHPAIAGALDLVSLNDRTAWPITRETFLDCARQFFQAAISRYRNRIGIIAAYGNQKEVKLDEKLHKQDVDFVIRTLKNNRHLAKIIFPFDCAIPSETALLQRLGSVTGLISLQLKAPSFSDFCNSLCIAIDENPTLCQFDLEYSPPGSNIKITYLGKSLLPQEALLARIHANASDAALMKDLWVLQSCRLPPPVNTLILAYLADPYDIRIIHFASKLESLIPKALCDRVKVTFTENIDAPTRDNVETVFKFPHSKVGVHINTDMREFLEHLSHRRYPQLTKPHEFFRAFLLSSSPSQLQELSKRLIKNTIPPRDVYTSNFEIFSRKTTPQRLARYCNLNKAILHLEKIFSGWEINLPKLVEDMQDKKYAILQIKLRPHLKYVPFEFDFYGKTVQGEFFGNIFELAKMLLTHAEFRKMKEDPYVKTLRDPFYVIKFLEPLREEKPPIHAKTLENAIFNPKNFLLLETNQKDADELLKIIKLLKQEPLSVDWVNTLILEIDSAPVVLKILNQLEPTLRNKKTLEWLYAKPEQLDQLADAMDAVILLKKDHLKTKADAKGTEVVLLNESEFSSFMKSHTHIESMAETTAAPRRKQALLSQLSLLRKQKKDDKEEKDAKKNGPAAAAAADSPRRKG